MVTGEGAAENGQYPEGEKEYCETSYGGSQPRIQRRISMESYEHRSTKKKGLTTVAAIVQ